jgi:hypothetical protein
MSNEKSVEELMELARKPLKKVKQMMVQYDDVHKFALMYQLKGSKKNLVPTYIIFELYANWCSEYDMDRYSRLKFFKIFNSLFERVKKNGETMYYVVGRGMDLTTYTIAEKKLLKNAYKQRILEHVRNQKTVKRKKDLYKDKGQSETGIIESSERSESET